MTRSEHSHEFCFLYSTFPDTESAEMAARAVIAAKLAACVNIHPPMKSLYVWEGKIADGAEVAVFVKTRRALVDDVIGALRPLHPYSVPCFLILPVEGGNAAYLAWARAQTERGTEI